MNCKHIRRSQRSHTISKTSQGKLQIEKSYDDGGKCNLGLNYLEHSVVVQELEFAINLALRSFVKLR